jgi:hydroxyacylglutathione hydrolase
MVNLDPKLCVVVDPGDASPVQTYLEQHQLKVEAILLTHHHGDHINGASELNKKWKAPIYAPAKNKLQIPFATHFVSEGQTIELFGKNLKFEVLEVPGHTLGHIVFFERNKKWLFSGDVLFGLGCGRVFEGSMLQAFESLRRIKDLPNETSVFCTHEYTETNLCFSKKLTSSYELQKYEENLNRKRSLGLPSVPLDLGVEKKTNLFLMANDVERFTYLRELRNQG